jgi:hypothetical protein
VLDQIKTAEARAIAKEAYIYGFSIIDNSRVQYEYFVDRENSQFKAPWNHLANIPRSLRLQIPPFRRRTRTRPIGGSALI